MPDRTKKIIKLEQVEVSKQVSWAFKDAEVGDKVDGFKVVMTDEVECDHPEWRWTLRNKKSDEPPKIDGICQICGKEQRYVGEELEHKQESEDTVK